MRGECAREVCSDQKALEIRCAAPARQNRTPVANGSAKGSRREADLREKQDLGGATCRTSYLQAVRRRCRSQNGKRRPDSEKARAFLRGSLCGIDAEQN
jgi:hypothetical protein